MTYLDDVSETSNSPVARLLRLADKEIDDLMSGTSADPARAKARVAAFGEAIQVITFDTTEDIKNTLMLRYEARNPDVATEEDEEEGER